MLKKVAITGGIATGKSTLLELLKNLGFPTLSCDEIVKNLYQRKDLQKKLVKHFGEEILLEKGKVDTKLLLERILKSSHLKKDLENLLHPEVLKEIFAFFKREEEKGEKICFVEVPLLFEVSWEKYFDEVWVITCSEETQKERIQKLREVPSLVLELSKSQLPLKEKEKRGDRVFSSEVSLENLKKELKELLKEYLKEKNPL